MADGPAAADAWRASDAAPPGDVPDLRPLDEEVLAVAFDGRLELIAENGTATEVLGPSELGTPLYYRLETNGENLLLRAADDQGGRQHVVAIDGAVRRSTLLPNGWANLGSVLGDDGSVVEWRGGAAEAMRVVDPAGGTKALPGYGPLGRSPRAGYLAVAAFAQGSSSEASWWDLTTGSVSLVPGMAISVGREAVVARTGSGVLVSRPAQSIAIDLPTTGVLRLALEDATGRFVALRVAPHAELSVLDLQLGTSRSVLLTPPIGYVAFELCRGGIIHTGPLAMDGDGGIFQVFRNDDHASVFRTLDGTTWERIGRTLSDIAAVEIDVVGGTIQITGAPHLGRNAECFDGASGMSAAPVWVHPNTAELSSDFTEFVRPADGTIYDHLGPLAIGEAQISPSGRRVAYWDGLELKRLDLMGGTVDSVAQATGSDQPSEPAWMTRK